jgi:hypothetical protein
VLLALAAPALAGNGNTLYLIQESSPGTTDGNNFLSDQTRANYSSIGTLLHPAKQSGTGNEASITIKGDCSAVAASDCGHVTFRQDNSTEGLVGIIAGLFNLAPLDPNLATVVIAGKGSADLRQLGGNNVASLSVVDGDGSIHQSGIDNVATLTLLGGAGGSISQIGNDHQGSLTVNSIGNGGASLYEWGSNQTYSSALTISTNDWVSIYRIGG